MFYNKQSQILVYTVCPDQFISKIFQFQGIPSAFFLALYKQDNSLTVFIWGCIVKTILHVNIYISSNESFEYDNPLCYLHIKTTVFCISKIKTSWISDSILQEMLSQIFDIFQADMALYS